MPAACSVMFRWQSCQSSSSTLLTSSMLSFVRCRFTLGFHRTNVKPLSVNTRPFMNDSGDRFALAWSRLSSRHGAAPREMITAHRLRARRTAPPKVVSRIGATVRGSSRDTCPQSCLVRLLAPVNSLADSLVAGCARPCPRGAPRLLAGASVLAGGPIGLAPRGSRTVKTSVQVRNLICARFCARDAEGRTETRETEKAQDGPLLRVYRGQRGYPRLPETAETCVVWLITQRSRVQIPPPLPRPEALFRTGRGPLACGLLTDLLTRLGLTPISAGL